MKKKFTDWALNCILATTLVFGAGVLGLLAVISRWAERRPWRYR